MIHISLKGYNDANNADHLRVLSMTFELNLIVTKHHGGEHWLNIRPTIYYLAVPRFKWNVFLHQFMNSSNDNV